MIFNIPQFIDIEDKIVGPLTAKQLGWLAVGGVLALLFWSIFDLVTFIIAAIFLAIVFGGIAFYRPNGQPLTTLIGSMFAFMMKPKLYMWKRVPDKKSLAKRKKTINANAHLHDHKNVTLEEIRKVSQLLEIKKK